jgi:hypothetical protein
MERTRLGYEILVRLKMDELLEREFGHFGESVPSPAVFQEQSCLQIGILPFPDGR